MSTVAVLSRTIAAPAFFETIQTMYVELVGNVDLRDVGNRFVVLGEDATIQIWTMDLEWIDGPENIDRLEVVYVYRTMEDAQQMMDSLKALTETQFVRYHEILMDAPNHG